MGPVFAFPSIRFPAFGPGIKRVNAQLTVGVNCALLVFIKHF